MGLRLRKIFAEWGWVILALLGFFLAGTGFAFWWVNGFDDRLAALAFSFAQAILAGGVVAGILRAAQTAGFFKDQLRDVIYSDDLKGSLIDARVAWRNLTRGLFRQRFASLDDNDLKSLSVDTLIGSADFFYKSHRRRIDLDWADAERTTIAITEVVNAVLVTADVGREIKFPNRYDPDAGGSKRRTLEYTFVDQSGTEITVTEASIKTGVDGGQDVTTRLLPNATYDLERCTRKTQKLDSDPFLNYRANCLWANPEIDVRIAPGSGLQFYFREMGTPIAFKPLDGRDIDGLLTELNARCNALCLPNQGYMIVVVRR